MKSPVSSIMINVRNQQRLIIFLLLLCPCRTSAADLPLAIIATNSFYSQNNYFDRVSNRFERDRRINLLTIAPTLTLSPARDTLIYIRGDLEWEYELDADPKTENTADSLETFMTSAYLNVDLQAVQMIAGLQPFLIARGLITADDAVAVTFIGDHDRWSLIGQFGRIMQDSPMAALTLDYEPGPFERLALFSAWFRDNEDALATTLPDSLQILAPTSEGELWWVGAMTDLFLGQALLSLTAAYQFGEVNFHHLLGQTRRDVRAYMVDISLSVNVGRRMSGELFLFAASGDDDDSDGVLRAFCSPMAFNPRAQIFFDPEWLDRDTESVMTYGGGGIRGAV
ncbi:MAG: hypothetical protein HKP58_12695, partial [Desulfatitalea sp.]|nr:hypothetical protein [Desulfatitalea sp.]NNK01258.1 hypothetical protein [Desulfatitalea sp.]